MSFMTELPRPVITVTSMPGVCAALSEMRNWNLCHFAVQDFFVRSTSSGNLESPGAPCETMGLLFASALIPNEVDSSVQEDLATVE